MSLFRNLETKCFLIFLWSLDVKKFVGDLRTEDKHNLIIKKQNAELKGLPGAASTSVLLSVWGKRDPSIALNVQNWALVSVEGSNC